MVYQRISKSQVSKMVIVNSNSRNLVIYTVTIILDCLDSLKRLLKVASGRDRLVVKCFKTIIFSDSLKLCCNYVCLCSQRKANLKTLSGCVTSAGPNAETQEHVKAFTFLQYKHLSFKQEVTISLYCIAVQLNICMKSLEDYMAEVYVCHDNCHTKF